MGPLVAVIDDDAGIRDLMACILEEHGYQPLLLEPGNDALETLRRVRPAAVILDPNLSPRRRASTLLAELAQDASLAILPVLVYSTDVRRLEEQSPQRRAHGYGLPRMRS